MLCNYVHKELRSLKFSQSNQIARIQLTLKKRLLLKDSVTSSTVASFHMQKCLYAHKSPQTHTHTQASTTITYVNKSLYTQIQYTPVHKHIKHTCTTATHARTYTLHTLVKPVQTDSTLELYLGRCFKSLRGNGRATEVGEQQKKGKRSR